MTTDGTYTAVVNRFEEELAVLLLEEDGNTVDEVVVEKESLPAAGRHVDAVLLVDVEDEDLSDPSYQEAETANRNQSSQRRFDNLSQRPPGDQEDA